MESVPEKSSSMESKHACMRSCSSPGSTRGGGGPPARYPLLVVSLTLIGRVHLQRELDFCWAWKKG